MKSKLTFFLAILLIAGTAKAAWPTGITGTGVSGDPYQIATAIQLADLAAYVNAGNSAATSGKFYKLTANLDLSAYTNWTPIGSAEQPFKGTFDGNGHTISNLKGNYTTGNIGLFASIEEANIQKLSVVYAQIGISGDGAGAWNYGIIAGKATNSSVSDCYTDGSIEAKGNVGGIVGLQSGGTLTNSYSFATVHGINAGGIIGAAVSTATITYCYSGGNVTGYDNIGGIAGLINASTLQNCVSLSRNISLLDAGNTGRIFGQDENGSSSYNNNYALESQLVNGATVTGGTTANNNGANLSLAQLQTAASYPAGWDFSTVWTIRENLSFPYLSWQSNNTTDASVFNLATGMWSVGNDISNSCAWDGTVLAVNNGADIEITGTVSDGKRIEVAAGATANITLNGVSIIGMPSGIYPYQNACPLWQHSGSTLQLTLLGNNTLTANTHAPGIRCEDATLTVTTASTGSLTATGGAGAAGIGGRNGSTGGNITINKGTVTANGGSDATGIGNGTPLAYNMPALPATSTITYGQPLSGSAIASANATAISDGATITGTWAWANGATVPNAVGTLQYKATFTPTDQAYIPSDYRITVTVTPKPITINPTANQSKIYGDSDPVFAYTIAPSTPLVGSDVLTGALSRMAGENVTAGNYAYTIGTLQAANPSYTITLNAGTFEIKKKTLILVASGATITLNSTMLFNDYALSVTGLVGEDMLTMSSLSVNDAQSTTSAITDFSSRKATVRLTYNTASPGSGTTVTLAINSINYTGSASVTVNINTATGANETTPILVDQSNIQRFNDFAMTASGRTLCYKLAENISMAAMPTDPDGSNWKSIFSYSSSRYNPPDFFSGVYDGGGFTITGMVINEPTQNYVGMFGTIKGGTIKNLVLTNASVTGYSCAGGICGILLDGTIAKCSAAGEITVADLYAGGVCGIMSGTGASRLIEQCSSSGQIEGASAGGICGNVNGTVKNCYSTANIISSNTGGGVVGSFSNSAGTQMLNCYAAGNVSAGNYLGGVAANVNGSDITVSDCVALNGSVTGTSIVGKVFGQLWNATAQNNYALNEMTCTSVGLPHFDGVGINRANIDTQAKWQALTWTNAWDFINIWKWDSTLKRPILKWQ